MRDPFRTVPVCPMCDGPCRHEMERSDHRFPDRLPRSEDAAPLPEKKAKPNLRARRPSEDRMIRPSEDR